MSDSSGSSLFWLKGAKCTPSRLLLAVLLSLRHCLMRFRQMSRQDATVLALFAISLLAVYIALETVTLVAGVDIPDNRHWILNLLFNLLGYSTVFVPGYVIIQYVRKTGYLESGAKKLLEPVIRLCVFGTEDSVDDSIAAAEAKQVKAKQARTEWQNGVVLVICFFGLQISYLTWGVLQEKIMTRTYTDSTGSTGQFRDSQFLVFVNRILAFAIALLYITFIRQPRHRAPLYKYSYCSFSNIMSSWFQYEALKFVSFPTQVLAKASKIIPVMIMGKVVSNKKYEFYEYIVAVLISLGMVFFLFGSQEDRGKSSSETTLSGVILLLGYMSSDSFTSNWQNELFDTYKMSSVQMMCGVNLFSCLLTSASLLQQGIFYTSLVFMSQFPAFTFDCIILSICSAVGQLFIYYTISQFGAVAFIIIMTLRQAMAIILSCVLYDHAISPSGVFGVTIVFGAMFLKIYCGQQLKKKKMAQKAIAEQSSPAAVEIKS